MKAVLGLSMTSHGIAWALCDRRSADATPLDDDAFDVDSADQLAARAAAAARSAQAIAASSGQHVASIGVCAAEDDRMAELLDLLAGAGFDDVRAVPEPFATTDPDDIGAAARLRAARSAALAVATNLVARAPRPVAVRVVAPRRYTAARAAAAAAAAIAAGLLTVGSQYVEPVPGPAADDGAITAAAEPQLVTVATPREATRSVALPEEEFVAERAARTPIVEPVEPAASAVQTAAEPVQPVAHAESPVPQAIPVVRASVPAVAQATVDPRPVQQPVALAVPAGAAPVQHIPAAVTGPIGAAPAAAPHLATDPAPGPAALPQPALPLPASPPAPAPVPAPAPAPAPAGLWFLGAMP
ncbi:hypothetical protein [Mycolicibacterium setense]|uniref:hypothetical protein n=1 Tax=Mycolicibacterium setense TaxID=431269 RepID=UPI000B008D50|nr:hypothetical protein [Mycolicibacterium setense]